MTIFFLLLLFYLFLSLFFFFVLSPFLRLVFTYLSTSFFVVSCYSDPSPLNSRRPSTDSIGAGYSYIRNNLKHESTSGAYLSEAANKKNRTDKLSSKQMKKVNFEESEKDGPPVIEGGRVTASLVKVHI